MTARGSEDKEEKKVERVCGGLNDNGTHKLIYFNTQSQLVELFGRD